MNPIINPEVNTSNLVADASNNDYTHEWWERYSLLLVPMLLITLALAYAWPSYPDLTPFIWVWLILVNGVLWYVSLRVERQVKGGHYDSGWFQLHAKSMPVKKRRFVSHLIRAGAMLTLMGTVATILRTSRGDFGSATTYLPIYLVPSLIISTLFVIVLPDRAARMEGLLNSRLRLKGTVLLVGVIVVGIAYFLTFRLSPYANNGPPSSWSHLLNFAQHEAQRIDKGAVVESVISQPPYNSDPPYSPQTTAFEADFVFRRPNASSIRIVVLDTDPPRLQSVDSEWDSISFNDGSSKDGSSLISDLLSKLSENLSYIKLSPRDAYRLTEQEGLAFAQQVAPGYSPSVESSMFLSHDWQEWFGARAGWNIDYTVKKGIVYHSLNFRVDGSTGKILARERWPEDLKPDPTPTGVDPTPEAYHP